MRPGSLRRGQGWLITCCRKAGRLVTGPARPGWVRSIRHRADAAQVRRGSSWAVVQTTSRASACEHEALLHLKLYSMPSMLHS